MNNDVRLDPDGDMLWWHFPEGYFDDVRYDSQCDCKYNRWPNPQGTGMGSHYDLAAFRTDNMNFAGEYDVMLRLPAVPAGQYEIRLGYVANGLMGIAQIYFGQNSEYMQPTGIPLNLGWGGGMPKVGMISRRCICLMIFIMTCRIISKERQPSPKMIRLCVIWVYERACLRV